MKDRVTESVSRETTGASGYTAPHMEPAKKAVKELPSYGGWARFPLADTRAVRPEKARDLTPVAGTNLARGMGRAYGDTALLTGGTLVLTTRLDRILSFDTETGVIRAEAGLTLGDLIDASLPRGWFVPVTPGTKYCSLGGCFAADVHGKNHHRDGTFSRHVSEIELVMADGSSRRVGPGDDLFWATAGGMGLTGIIREVTLQLVRVETAYMKVRHIKTRGLDHTVDLLSDPAHDATYTVAWLDCLAQGARLGRGIFMAGEHAAKSEISLRIERPLEPGRQRAKPFPIDLPGWALNKWTVKAFNAFYRAVQGSKGDFTCPYDKFFYPLDGIHGWNRMYGKRGFVQYQYVMPTDAARAGTREVLTQLSGAGKASFLAVLKRFGPEGQGLLSFPTEGLTLALDIPLSDDLPSFLDKLDEIVLRHGGRVYLAKDSRMKPEMFRASYPRVGQFCSLKSQVDPEWTFDSDQARRLGLCR